MIKRLLKNEHHKKYFFNTGWLLGEKVIRIVINLIIGVIVPRYLGPENYGLLSIAINTVMILSVISSLGLGDIVIRELINRNYDEDTILFTAFLLRQLFSLVIIIISGSIIFYFNSFYFISLN